MDSSNAEKVYNRAYDQAFATGGKQSDWIKAGVKAVAEWRDAEIEVLRKLLAAAEAAKADAWDEGAEIVLRVVGIESVENALANLAENGHANPYRGERRLDGRP